MSKKQKMTPVLSENGHETQEKVMSPYEVLLAEVEKLEDELTKLKSLKLLNVDQTLEIKATSVEATLTIKGGPFTNDLIEQVLFEIGRNYRHVLFVLPKQEEQLALLKARAEEMKAAEENDGSAGANTVGGGGANNDSGTK